MVQIMPLKVPDIAMPGAVMTPVLRLRGKRGHAEQRSNRQGPTKHWFHEITFLNVAKKNCVQVHIKLSTPQRANTLTCLLIFTWTSPMCNSSSETAAGRAELRSSQSIPQQFDAGQKHSDVQKPVKQNLSNTPRQAHPDPHAQRRQGKQDQ